MNIFTNLRLQKIFLVLIIPPFLIMLAYFFSPENIAWYGLAPHPYFVVSILLSGYFGLQFALAISMLLSLQYMILLHFQTDYQQVETLLTLEYFILPIAIIILSSLLGEFRTRTQARINSVEKKKLESDNITHSLLGRINMMNKESLELKKQIITKLDTTGHIFKMTSRLQSLNLSDIIDGYKEILTETLHVDEAVIYRLDPTKQAFIPIKKVYQQEASYLDQEIPIADIKDPIFYNAFTNKALTTIDNIDDEKALLSNSDTILAMPILVMGDVFGMVKVNQMPFLNYTPSNFQLLELYTQWMANSISYALEYHNISRQSIMNPQLDIFTNYYFHQRLTEEYDQAKRYNSHFSLVRMSLKTPPENTLKLEHIRKVISQIIKKYSRTMDCICEGSDQTTFDIILSHSSANETQGYINNIEEHINDLAGSDQLKKHLALDYSYSLFNEKLTLNEMTDNYQRVIH